MSSGNFDNFPSGDRAAVNDPSSAVLTVSIFADRPHLRGALRDDVRDAGFRVTQLGDLAALIDGTALPLGDIVLVDCPDVDGARLAALTRVDQQVRQAGAQLIVSTSVAALDDVFGCLDQSNPQILIDPSRAEYVIALGYALAAAAGDLRVRELSEEDRLIVLRLAEQVAQIAKLLEGFDGAPASNPLTDGGDGLFRFESPRTAFAPRVDEGSQRLVRAARPALPDPRLVRRMIRNRQLRARYFAGDLFADPAWDMLLDLAAARAEHIRVSVTSLCIASGVPPTTALRWIGQMITAGLMERIDDETDRRRAFITLTDKGADALARYFAEIGSSALYAV